MCTRYCMELSPELRPYIEYDIEEKNGIKYPVFTVLTREPGEEISFIHDRMPVILGKEKALITRYPLP